MKINRLKSSKEGENIQSHLFFNQKRLARKISPKLISKFNHNRSPSSDSQKNFYIRNIMKPFLKIQTQQQQLYNQIVNKNKVGYSMHTPTKSEGIIQYKKNTNETPFKKIDMSFFNQKEAEIQDKQTIISMLIQENNELKKKNENLNKVIKNYNSINEQIENKLMKSNESNTIQEKLGRQVALLKQQNVILKFKLSNYKTQNPNQFHKVNLISLEQYIHELQQSNQVLKSENQKAKIQNDHLRRKLHRDVEEVRKNSNAQLASIREKYMKLLQNHQNLSKNHFQMTQKMNKMIKEIQSGVFLDLKLQNSLQLSSCSQSKLLSSCTDSKLLSSSTESKFIEENWQ